MSFSPDAATHLINRERPTELYALGPTVELLTADTEEPSVPGLIRGSVPPGHAIPLHAHAEPETFYLLSGRLQAAAVTSTDARWVEVDTGGILHVPPHARHAFRNPGTETAVALIITTPSMLRFFERIGTPLEQVDPSQPPPPEVLERFLAVTTERGDWNASPEQNAAIGITLGPTP